MKNRENPPKDGCAGYHTNEGDYDCAYEPIIDCEDCIYTKYGRKNPQAKCNQRKEKS